MPWKPRKSPISKMQVVLIQVNSDFRVALPLMQRLTSDVALLHDDSYKSIAHDQWHGMGWQLLEMTWSLSHQNVSWHQTAADRVCNHAFDWLCAFILLLKLFYGYLWFSMFECGWCESLGSRWVDWSPAGDDPLLSHYRNLNPFQIIRILRLLQITINLILPSAKQLLRNLKYLHHNLILQLSRDLR